LALYGLDGVMRTYYMYHSIYQTQSSFLLPRQLKVKSPVKAAMELPKQAQPFKSNLFPAQPAAPAKNLFAPPPQQEEEKINPNKILFQQMVNNISNPNPSFEQELRARQQQID